MTDIDSTGDSEGAGSSTESKPNWRREMEARLKEAEARASAAEESASQYQRRDTFRSAGLDPDDARVSYFVKGYEGDLTVEAIRAEAEAAGFVGANAPDPQPRALTEALNGEQRIQAAGEGAEPVGSPDLDERIRATTNEDELRALMESKGFLWGAST